MSKRVLIYGDSNTWGMNGFGARYDSHSQWPVILQDLLGDNYCVIQEGLSGRLAGDCNSEDVHRNGRTGFEIIMRSAWPIDYLIVALGTNDLKSKYGRSVDEIFDDLIWYKKRVMDYAKDNDWANLPKAVVYVGISNYGLNDFIDRDQKIARQVNDLVAASGECYVELADLEHSKDGLHYSESDHKKVADRVYGVLMKVAREA